jgi:hypothetical protein
LSAAEAQLSEPVQLVQVANREADIFELFAQPRQANSELLIRVKTNRTLKQAWGKLFTALSQAPVLGELQVEVRRTPQREARIAQVQLRGLHVTLAAPEYLAQQIAQSTGHLQHRSLATDGDDLPGSADPRGVLRSDPRAQGVAVIAP